jgi:glycosyltransferase involved in cell wall biosynthesis
VERHRLRIAIVGNWPPPAGGVAVHVEALARHLAARGADVRVLDVGEGAHRGGPVVPARAPHRFAAGLVRAAAERRLVHVHTNGANPKSWLVALAAGRARAPGGPAGVLTLHSGLGPGWLASGNAAARRALARSACAGFGRVVAVSEPIAAALGAAGVPREKLAVLPAFSPSVVGARATPGALGPFRAAHAPLYAAALAPGPTYGADVLLPAFEEVRRSRPRAGLVLFGPGTAGLDAGRAGVLALGELAHAEAAGAIEAADLFVRPTRADGDAVSVREALALGTRVIATAVGHRPAGCLLVPPGDARALAAAMALAGDGGARPGRVAGPDPFDTLCALYAALWRGPAGLGRPRPRTDGGRGRARAPTLQP